MKKRDFFLIIGISVLCLISLSQNLSAQSNVEVEKMIDDSYLETFGRYPSDRERNSWIEPVTKQKMSYDTIIKNHLSFMISSDGEKELQQTIIRSYLATFGREPKAGEILSWVNGIKRKGGMTFRDVVSEHIDFMVENKLNQGFEEMKQTIIRSYQAIFKRQPTIQELNSWIQNIKQNRTPYWELLVFHARFLGAYKE